MGNNIVIDPLTRIEGHSKWTVFLNGLGTAITDVQASGTMFRGFENILLRRDPRDAPVITQRICGV
jgi:Ni,Fe-hydrogenase I large subunit